MERLADDLWLLAGRPRYAFNVYLMGDVSHPVTPPWRDPGALAAFAAALP